MNVYRNAAGTVLRAEPGSKLDVRLSRLHTWDCVEPADREPLPGGAMNADEFVASLEDEDDPDGE